MASTENDEVEESAKKQVCIGSDQVKSMQTRKYTSTVVPKCRYWKEALEDSEETNTTFDVPRLVTSSVPELRELKRLHDQRYAVL